MLRNKSHIRVLHVLGRLDHGGVEVWLMNVLRHIDRDVFHLDFAVHTHKPATFDAEARQLGARILPLDAPRQAPISYNRRLAQLIATTGPYDVVHSHVHFFSGVVLRQAERRGIPIRIAHSHNDTRVLDARVGLFRWVYQQATRRWIDRYATAGLACSDWAAAALFGEQWKADRRWRVLRYGIDFSRFSQKTEREKVLRPLGIAPERQIIGQIGRLAVQKNHEFSIRVLKELVDSGVNVHFLIVGGGSLESDIRAQIEASGLSERVTLVGDQNDVVPYLSVMDLMIFPSFNEGLGIVMLEAQAAGVPVVASDHVPEDGIVLPNLVDRLSLQAGPAAWATAIAQRLARAANVPAETAAAMSQSDFAISKSVEQLGRIYSGDYNKI